MNQEKALTLINKMLFGLQRVRSMTIEELTRLGFEEHTVRTVISDLIPWMHGERGDALLTSLARVSSSGYVTGQQLYNYMTILHTLDRNLLMMISAASETMYPKPNLEWIRELGM